MGLQVLITGAGGQLGRAAAEELESRGWTFCALTRRELDVTDQAAVEHAMAAARPQVVLHCAAWTAVDAAEDEPEACRRLNVLGAALVAEACRRHGAAMVYPSSDYVFDGRGERPWRPEDVCAPLSVYGRSKWEGEQAVRSALSRYFIVRTSWLFGKEGHNFVRTMLRLGREGRDVQVVDDQVGGPTYAADLARLLCDMAAREDYGTYHAANSGWCSWYEFAGEIFRQAALPGSVTPISSADYPARAARPRNSRLDMSALAEHGFAPLPPWQDALRRFLKEIGEEHG